MSAFMVSKGHMDALMTFCVANKVYGSGSGGYIDADAADKIGQKLWLENYRSVCARYPDSDNGPEPEYFFHRLCKVPTAVEAVKLLNCLEYQSCEHDAFDEGLYHRLLKTICDKLRGYDDAAWAL